MRINNPKKSYSSSPNADEEKSHKNSARKSKFDVQKTKSEVGSKKLLLGVSGQAKIDSKTQKALSLRAKRSSPKLY